MVGPDLLFEKSLQMPLDNEVGRTTRLEAEKAARRLL